MSLDLLEGYLTITQICMMPLIYIATYRTSKNLSPKRFITLLITLAIFFINFIVLIAIS